MLLPHGVEVHELQCHLDERGQLTELFKSSRLNVEIQQVNLSSSNAGSLRGVHCHLHHDDLMAASHGSFELGLHDLRPGSTTEGLSATMRLTAFQQIVRIPVGVAHGFWFAEDTMMIYGFTKPYDSEDVLGCRWNDPELGFEWSVTGEPMLSERDRTAGTLAQLREQIRSKYLDLRSRTNADSFSVRA